jgi:hypothetical protein
MDLHIRYDLLSDYLTLFGCLQDILLYGVGDLQTNWWDSTCYPHGGG